MTNLIDLFWTEDVWLPPNVSWSDLTNYSGNGKGEVNYRKFSDLLIPVFGAFVVIALRFTAEKWDIFQGIFFLNFLPVINYWRGGVSYLLHELMISERLFDLWLKRILKGRLRLNGKYRKCFNFFLQSSFSAFWKISRSKGIGPQESCNQWRPRGPFSAKKKDNEESSAYL